MLLASVGEVTGPTLLGGNIPGWDTLLGLIIELGGMVVGYTISGLILSSNTLYKKFATKIIYTKLIKDIIEGTKTAAHSFFLNLFKLNISL